MSPFIIWLLGLSFLFGGLDGIGRQKQKNQSVIGNCYYCNRWCCSMRINISQLKC